MNHYTAEEAKTMVIPESVKEVLKLELVLEKIEMAKKSMLYYEKEARGKKNPMMKESLEKSREFWKGRYYGLSEFYDIVKRNVR